MDSTISYSGNKHLDSPLSQAVFRCFHSHGDRQLYPKWGPGENVFRKSYDGTDDWWHFERPFECLVRRKEYADVIWAGACTVLISNRVLELFRSAGVTGCDVFPTNLRLMFPHEPEDAVFWQIVPTGWGGVVPARSGIRQICDPRGEGRLLYSAASDLGALIDLEQWDGSDFFFVWPFPNFWWVTQKVVDILHENSIERFKLLSPEELTILTDETDGSAFMPGSLRHYLPEPRAREIGEPLGIY